MSAIDPADLPNRVSDTQIRQEIAAGINAGALPFPDANTLFYVFTPPGVVVTWDDGEDSAHNFHGYHSYDGRGGFAYAVIPFNDVGLYEMTRTCSHELAEAVTDPQPNTGWYDDHNGEIADIVNELYDNNRVGPDGFWDSLTASDGTVYWVEKEWSNKDGKPVAFAN